MLGSKACTTTAQLEFSFIFKIYLESVSTSLPGVYVEVRGQPGESVLFLPSGFKGLGSGHQACAESYFTCLTMSLASTPFFLPFPLPTSLLLDLS